MKKRDGRARQTARRARARADGPAEKTPAEAQAIADHIVGADKVPRGSGPDRTAPAEIEYWATRPFGYGNLALDRGSVFRLTGMVNDKLLTDLGYIKPVETSGRYPCRVCGQPFLDLGSLNGHGQRRHARKVAGVPPPMRQPNETEVSYQNRLDHWAVTRGAAEDARLDREDQHIDQVAPLNLENTQASREA